MPGSAAHGGVTAGPRGAALGVEQAGLVRGDDELNPVPGAQLGQQMGHVRFGGARGDEQGAGDLGVGHASKPTCAPRWETQPTSRPPRTADPSPARAPYSAGSRTRTNTKLRVSRKSSPSSVEGPELIWRRCPAAVSPSLLASASMIGTLPDYRPALIEGPPIRGLPAIGFVPPCRAAARIRRAAQVTSPGRRHGPGSTWRGAWTVPS
jgi:hypothetical protein